MNSAGLCRAEDDEKPVKSGENRSTRHIPEPGILNVSVGQQISLTCELPYGAPQIESYNWSIPGVTFSNYTASVNAGTLYTNFPTDDSDVTFYWADGRSKIVTCSFNVNGQTNQCSTTFNVLRPKATIIPAITGQVQITNIVNDPNLPNGTYLTLQGSNNNIPGITFTITNEDTNGYYFFVQIGTFHWADTYFNTNRHRPVNINYGPALDAGINPTNWPYPFYITTNITSDSPCQPCLPTMSSVCRTDYFNMYLMFSNFSLNAMPVPLKVVHWNWSGYGTNQDSHSIDGNWLLENPISNCLPAIDTFTYPQWSSNWNPAQRVFHN